MSIQPDSLSDVYTNTPYFDIYISVHTPTIASPFICRDFQEVKLG